LQGVELVQALAETGHCDSSAYERCLLAVLELEPKQDEDVFGQAGDLNLGLSSLAHLAKSPKYRQTLSYLTQLLYLERRFMRDNAMISRVTEGLHQAKRQYDHYHDIEAASSNIGDLYQETFGNIGHRMQIYGKHEFLSQTHIAAKIRTALLASIRFTLLWRQSGGRPLQSLVYRNTIFMTATQLQNT